MQRILKQPILIENNGNFELPGITISSFNKINEIFYKTFSNNIEGFELYKEINLLLDELDSINRKGFINETNLQALPLINECISILLKDYSEYRKMQEEYGETSGSFVWIGVEGYKVKDAMLLYRWSYNLIILKLLMYSEAYIKHNVSKNIDNDLLLDFKNISKLLSSKLEPSIREKFARKGISYISNIYTGFDTEYVSIDSKTNKLLSVQMSLTTSLLLKLPLKTNFDFEEFNVFANDVYKKDTEEIDEIRSAVKMDMIKEYINKSIEYHRILNNNYLYDLTMEKLIRILIEKGIRFVKKDDSITFIFDSDKIREYYKTTNKYSFKELILTSNDIVKNDIEFNKEKVKCILDSIFKEIDMDININNTDKMNNLSDYKEFLEKISSNIDTNGYQNIIVNREPNTGKYKRSYNQSFTHDKISVTNIINNYIIGHMTSADLSMLEDFNELKHELNIINKSFITLSKPINIDGVNVYIRDTMLLAPGSKKSLQNIGSLYENIPKIDIDEKYKDNMEDFLMLEPDKFKEYAMRDALITMIHARYMEYFNNSIGGLGVPLTLSALSTKFIKKYWSENKYKGYQISKKYLLSDVSSSLTPKGLNVMKEIGMKSTLFIASYRGGRNESFMYGYELSEKVWYDYDLVSAYTTGMAALGTPDYTKGIKLNAEDLIELKFDDIFNSYTILSVKFTFKNKVKYPSIPVNIDENTTVYPLSGSAVITGLEYLVAKNQGCDMIIKEGYMIPFVKSSDLNKDKMIKPFASCIKEIQSLRNQYEKGTIGNLIYKEIGNSLYGLTVRGLNDKRKFDIKSQEMKRMVGNDLSNPLIASWITAFIRSVIGELLHYTHKLDGKVISVTTDGFITDIDDLETKVLELQAKEKKVNSLLKEYRKLRGYLSSSIEALEVKKSGKNMLTWSTRGQLSEASGIMAATGFQRGTASLSEIQKLFLEKFESDDKNIDFLRTSLRSPLDIYKDGGHVTRTFNDQKFRLMYDNKRLIIDSKDPNTKLLDSKPLSKSDIGELLRYIGNLPKSKQYSLNSGSTNNKYNSNIELISRNFLKALLKNELGLDINKFSNYKEIVMFLRNYSDDINISENYISQLKRRGNYVKIPWSIEAEKFVNYVKVKFPNFESDKIWK